MQRQTYCPGQNEPAMIDLPLILMYTSSVHKDESMISVKVTDLRHNLPAYLEKVRRGQRIRVTSRGKVIAELTPPSADPDEVAAARALLKNSVIRYEDPFEPAILPEEWESEG
jgi:prevent-host-death family protein